VTIVRLAGTDYGTLNHILGVWQGEVRMSLSSPTPWMKSVWLHGVQTDSADSVQLDFWSCS